MPASFDIISRLMVVAAIAMVVVPLMRRGTTQRVWPSVAVAALFLYLGSALVYPKLSNWHWPAAGAPATVTAAPGIAGQTGPDPRQIATLREATDAAPNNPEAWGELASALLASGNAAAAVEPLEKVYALTGGANAEWTLLLVDALMMSDDGARERVSGLIEKLLQVAPDHPKALYYGAELAFSRNDLTLARGRWQRLLVRAEQDTSEQAQNVRAVLEKRIAMATARLGESPPPDADSPATGPALAVTVSLSDEHAGSVSASTPVFILARNGPGPPVAVVRRSVADLPLTVTLTDANAMLPSRRLSNFDSVEIVARVALGGSPTVQSGDIFGAVDVATSRTEPVSIAMTELAP